MGAKSTVYITRQEALEFVFVHINQMSDRALADLVETINDDLLQNKNYEYSFGLHNFVVTENVEMTEDEKKNLDRLYDEFKKGREEDGSVWPEFTGPGT